MATHRQKTAAEYAAVQPFERDGKWYLEYDNFSDTFEIHDTEKEALDAKRINLTRLQQREAASAQAAAAAKASEQREAQLLASYEGFLSGPPREQGAQRKVLETRLRFDGVERTRKEDLEDRVRRRGARFDGDRLVDAAGAFRSLNKTEVEYAAHLIAKLTAADQAQAAMIAMPAPKTEEPSRVDGELVHSFTDDGRRFVEATVAPGSMLAARVGNTGFQPVQILIQQIRGSDEFALLTKNPDRAIANGSFTELLALAGLPAESELPEATNKISQQNTVQKENVTMSNDDESQAKPQLILAGFKDGRWIEVERATNDDDGQEFLDGMRSSFVHRGFTDMRTFTAAEFQQLTAESAEAAARPAPTAPAAPAKWAAGEGLGPRMAKEFNEAMRDASRAAQMFREKTGVRGVSETLSGGYVMMLGGGYGTNKHYQPGILELQAKHGSVVTKANYKAIIAGFKELSAKMGADPVIVDRTITPEEDAKNKEAEAKRQAEAAEQQARADAAKQVLDAVRPRWATAVVVAEFIKNESDSQSDYFGHSTQRRVAIGFRSGSREDFRQMRQAAAQFPETAHLATAPAAVEHRDNYSGGGGNFIADGGQHSSGWHIRTYTFGSYMPRDIEVAEHLQRPQTAAVAPAPAVGEAPAATPAVPAPAGKDGGVKVGRNAEKGGVEVTFPARPEQSVIDGLKAQGFRWSSFSKCWWAKFDDSRWVYATGLADRLNGVTTAAQPVAATPTPAVVPVPTKAEPAQITPAAIPTAPAEPERPQPQPSVPPPPVAQISAEFARAYAVEQLFVCRKTSDAMGIDFYKAEQLSYQQYLADHEGGRVEMLTDTAADARLLPLWAAGCARERERYEGPRIPGSGEVRAALELLVDDAQALLPAGDPRWARSSAPAIEELAESYIKREIGQQEFIEGVVLREGAIGCTDADARHHEMADVIRGIRHFCDAAKIDYSEVETRSYQEYCNAKEMGADVAVLNSDAVAEVVGVTENKPGLRR